MLQLHFVATVALGSQFLFFFFLFSSFFDLVCLFQMKRNAATSSLRRASIASWSWKYFQLWVVGCGLSVCLLVCCLFVCVSMCVVCLFVVVFVVVVFLLFFFSVVIVVIVVFLCYCCCCCCMLHVVVVVVVIMLQISCLFVPLGPLLDFGAKNPLIVSPIMRTCQH